MKTQTQKCTLFFIGTLDLLLLNYVLFGCFGLELVSAK